MAGPVVAAAVILDARRPVDGLADSKALDESKRDALDAMIRNRAVAYALGEASVEEIDAMNIYHATHLAMCRAINGLIDGGVTPDLVLVDGNKCPGSGVPEAAIVKGDGRVAAISAASIIAKVDRDRQMQSWHDHHPAFGFDKHKGYGTPQHLAALRSHGATPLHRLSFAPVRDSVRATERPSAGASA